MYSMVLMAAMSPTGDIPAAGGHRDGAGCTGAVVAYDGGCTGSAKKHFLGGGRGSGCDGGGLLGGKHKGNGCSGGGLLGGMRGNGCSGGGLFGKHKSSGGAGCHGGGVVYAAPAVMVDECAPGTTVVPSPTTPEKMPDTGKKPETKPETKPTTPTTKPKGD